MLQRAQFVAIDSSACTANVFWKREKRSVICKKIMTLFSTSRSAVFVEMSAWHVSGRCGLGAFRFCVLPLNSN